MERRAVKPSSAAGESGGALQDEANKEHRAGVEACATSNVSLSSPGAIDGVTLSEGQRCLLINQSTGTENGIYVYNSSEDTLIRPSDSLAGVTIDEGTTIYVRSGTSNGDARYEITATAAVDTDSQTWTSFRAGASNDSRVDAFVATSVAVMKTNNTPTVGYLTGTALQVLRVNASATDIEFANPTSGSDSRVDTLDAANTSVLKTDNTDTVAVATATSGNQLLQSNAAGDDIEFGTYGYFGSGAAGFYNDGGSLITEISHTDAVRGGTHSYIRWNTSPDIAVGMSYTESDSSPEGHTINKPGVITLSAEAVYFVDLCVSFDNSSTTSVTSYVQVDVTESTATTVFKSFTISAFHRTTGTGDCSASGSFSVSTSGKGTNCLLKVFVYKSSIGSNLTPSAANTSICIRSIPLT